MSSYATDYEHDSRLCSVFCKSIQASNSVYHTCMHINHTNISVVMKWWSSANPTCPLTISEYFRVHLHYYKAVCPKNEYGATLLDTMDNESYSELIDINLRTIITGQGCSIVTDLKYSYTHIHSYRHGIRRFTVWIMHCTTAAYYIKR